MNENALPWPSSLRTVSDPPIARINSEAIARPRPVPPWTRVVDASTCVNGAKIRS